MRYPNLFLLGAPKCGTTTIYSWLSQHPEIHAPKRKEPHHFYSPYGNELPLETYLSEYQGIGELLAIDASVWYLFSGTAVPRIQSSVSDARFIVCLRSPLQMAPSLHYQKVFTGHEEVASFRDAWSLNSERLNGSYVGIKNLQNADTSHMAYKQACFLGQQVSTLLNQVDRSQVYFCFLEEIAIEQSRVFAEICDFLCLDSVPVEFKFANKAKTWRHPHLRVALDRLSILKRKMGFNAKTGLFSGLHQINRTEKHYSAVPDDLLLDMKEAFQDDVALLSDLTGRDLSHWMG